MISSAALFAATLPSAAALRSHPVHRTVRLTVDGQPFTRVPIGHAVTLDAALHPLFSPTDKTSKDDFLLIRELKAGTAQNKTARLCHFTEIVSGSPPCGKRVNSTAPGKYYFQAFLVRGFIHNHTLRLRVLAKSAVVTVTWVESGPTYINISVSGAGHGLTDHWFAGPKAGQVMCLDRAIPDHSKCDTDQNVGGGTVNVFAGVDAPLPSGDQLWIVYSSGNALDPNYQSACQQPLSNQTGLCVIATTTVQFATAKISLPNTKFDNGGMHALEFTAELHSPTSFLASADLTMMLCQQGTNPMCG